MTFNYKLHGWFVESVCSVDYSKVPNPQKWFNQNVSSGGYR